MKRIMISLIIAFLGIAIGVVADRYYIFRTIKNDIELNSKEVYRTSLNDVYTEKKIYMYNYLLKEFWFNNEEE